MRFCYSCMQQIGDKKLKTCPHCGKPLKLPCDTTRFLKPGTVLQKKFVVGRVLGAGGFGNTYIGWNQLIQRRVAIKEYFPHQLSSRGGDGRTVSVSDVISQQRFRAGLHQFLEEARSIASLQDVKGVVQVFTFFEENGTGYIIMEYLEGMDVKTILEQRGNRMDYEWSRRVILTVLHTLREIHSRNVLHRDIAPDNIIVTNEGVIKLIDFGAAKHATELANVRSDIVLKSGYAPLEQYSKKVKQGAYTDLYAVAALFYRMLTGMKPQPANDRMNKDELKPLSELGIHVPQQAEFAIMVCLNLQPEFRLQSAQEFMEALDGTEFVPIYEPKWILPEPVPVSSFAKWKRWMNGMPVWKRAGILFAVIVLAGLCAASGIHLASTNNKSKSEMVQKGSKLLPPCEKLEEAEAEKKLEELEIDFNVVYRYRSDCKENLVVEMKPAAGSQMKEGDTVALTVESSEYVTVPDYSGKKHGQIRSDLKKRLGKKYKDSIFSYNYTSKQKQKDKCYAQTATGKIEISNLSSFKVQISWGTKESYEAVMPDLVGKTVAQAKKILKSEGIQMMIQEENAVYDSAYASGTIIYQNIRKGKTMNSNRADRQNYSVPEAVVVTLSKGREPTPEPTVRPTPEPTMRPTQKPKKTAKPPKREEEPLADW